MRASGETPLICFTTLVPAAVGASVLALPLGGGVAAAGAAVALTTAGMLASVAHLARPLRAPRSLAHLSSSWLSREIAAVAAFWALCVFWLAAELGAAGLPGLPLTGTGAWGAAVRCVEAVAAIVGVALLWAVARAYRVHGQPAWDGADTFWELVGAAIGSGGAVAAAAAAWQAACGCGSAVPLALLGLVPVCSLAASWLIVGYAHRAGARRVARRAEAEAFPRALAAAAQQRGGCDPSVYRACSALAEVLALLSLAAALGAVAAPLWLAACVGALSACALAELIAQASLRDRFYRRARSERYVACSRMRRG